MLSAARQSIPAHVATPSLNACTILNKLHTCNVFMVLFTHITITVKHCEQKYKLHTNQYSGMLRLATPVFGISNISNSNHYKVPHFLRMVVIAMFLCTKRLYNDPAN